MLDHCQSARKFCTERQVAEKALKSAGNKAGKDVEK